MKKCLWCEKDKPDEEVGGNELDSQDETKELGWVCDKCCMDFNGEPLPEGITHGIQLA